MSQAEDTNHEQPCIATGSYGNHPHHLSITQLQAEIQQLKKEYRNIKQERDMLMKALNIYNRRSMMPTSANSLEKLEKNSGSFK
jgi:predicted RNase H-like nuclease (RuvC/YqgF family)